MQSKETSALIERAWATDKCTISDAKSCLLYARTVQVLLPAFATALEQAEAAWSEADAEYAEFRRRRNDDLVTRADNAEVSATQTPDPQLGANHAGADDNLEFDELGLPRLTERETAEALLEMIRDGHREDAAGHLQELLVMFDSELRVRSSTQCEYGGFAAVRTERDRIATALEKASDRADRERAMADAASDTSRDALRDLAASRAAHDKTAQERDKLHGELAALERWAKVAGLVVEAVRVQQDNRHNMLPEPLVMVNLPPKGTP